ncbi:MAG: CheD, stimulates methylation of MCP protein [uncultured bacterium]|nr:MAG: CheD, stimulates methylation of MCP protein [uncultured bacterium]
MTIFVGIGEYAVTCQRDAIVRTLGLGSCVAVALFSKKNLAVGLLHVQLPESRVNQDLAARRPGSFADTGIPLLISEMAKHGCSAADLYVKLIGAAQVMDPNNTFNIGKRNYLAVKKVLWANRLFPVSEEIGGNFSRSVTITMENSNVLIHTPGYEDRVI